jgi:hypothetical protein
MLRTTILTSLAAALMLGIGAGITPAQSIAPVYDQDDYDRAQVDRYLDVEVWTSNSDGEFYDGDHIVIYFRASRDAFVSIYSIDTRGRVNLLFPTYEGEDNFVNGGVTYSLPGGKDDYNLVVSGPEGFENVQIIASREKFPIPRWYQGPELVVGNDEDRDSYMDWVNSNYFVDYAGQRFAYDRALVYVNQWEDDYFRPVYYPDYPSWTVYGNCYIDYPWGGSIYINGIYWGCAPMYIPRIPVGWHTITVYDPYGYCWEHDFHVSHYNTVVFNRTIINTSPEVKSKYKEVRMAGYRDPEQSGYPDFKTRKTEIVGSLKRSGSVTSTPGQGVDDVNMDASPKKFVRGSTKIVKTERGFETDASTAVIPDKGGKLGSTTRSRTGGSTYEGSKGKLESTEGTTNTGRTERTVTEGKTRSTSPSVESSGNQSGKGRSSGTTDRSGTSSTVERRKSTGRTETPTIQRQSPPATKQTPTVTDSGKKETKPESSSAGSTKSKSSDGGGTSTSKPQSQGSTKSSGGGGKAKK